MSFTGVNLGAFYQKTVPLSRRRFWWLSRRR